MPDNRNHTGHPHVRVMIVDDSLTARTVMQRIFASEPMIELLGTAGTAEQALETLDRVEVDVILLDLEMPGMGGLKALPHIIERARGAHVLVVSTLTSNGAEATMAALSMGASETLLKPRPGEFSDEYRNQLNAYILKLGKHRRGAKRKTDMPVREVPAAKAKRPDVIAIGASTGGIQSMCQMLEALPRKFEVPLLVTQHLPAGFIPVFARQLETASGLPAEIAEPDTIIRPGTILVAPATGHIVVKRSSRGLRVDISTERAPSGCRPSVDPMLGSLAQATDGKATAVLLSGMGRDGVLGAADLVAKGGTVLAQDAATCAVWGMPGAVVKEGLASACLEPVALAAKIAQLVRVPEWT